MDDCFDCALEVKAFHRHVALTDIVVLEDKCGVDHVVVGTTIDQASYASGIRQIVNWLVDSELDDRLNADGTINLDTFTYDDFTEFLL
ncbi:hypothetical protein ACHHYP_20448 [Achlya hypogyna]|uniref:Uncharacterized protein n=1 Tax=Achlya hypogyna TaxID=1202772 RepID=A0A1V9YM72_ACHHY|nr:hypothetical protein ACHHYP_20448 [Achlya hypogyna]